MREAEASQPPLDSAHIALPPAFRGVLVVGDVHGREELFAPLCALAAEEGLFLVALGDLVDRGPAPAGVLRRMLRLVAAGAGLLLRSNHDERLWRHLVRGGEVRNAELGATLAQLAAACDGARLREAFLRCYPRMPYVLGLGAAVMVHGAVLPEMLPPVARLDRRGRHHALYGQTRGRDARGLPVRVYDWLDRLPEGLLVIAGHDPLSDLKLRMRTGARGARLLHLDSGAGQGGPLSAVVLDRAGRPLGAWQMRPGESRPLSCSWVPDPERR